MSDKSIKALERAHAAFTKKETQAREGRKAMAEYEAANQAMRDKTAKLRMLRLAKEETDRKAAEAAAATKSATKPGKPGPKPAGKPAAAKKRR